MPASSARHSRPINAGESPPDLASRPQAKLGLFPQIALLAGIGLLVCSIADALARATLAPSPLLYWAGILLIALPIFFRLTSRDASAGERLALVCLLGLSLYAVKVVRDAPTFTFSDELIHAFNADQISAHHHLFHSNPVLEVTPSYPGLEGATSALTQLTGLSTYAAGMILVAAARLVLVGALFFLFRRVSGSARIAGLGVAVYAGNFNFVFFGAQYSYESLALPLLLLVLMVVAEREAAPRQAFRDWSMPVALGIAAIVVTHHLTSYLMVAVLLALSLAFGALRRSWRAPNPWPFAIGAGVLAILWLLVVAGATTGYLTPPFTGAIEAIKHTIGGESPPRELFQSNSYAGVTPIGARAIALLAVGLLLLGLPFGLLSYWKKYRSQPFALIFALAALGFFASLALRLAPAAWETGNRASEFLFVGLAFVIACACARIWKRGSGPIWGRRLLLTMSLGVILVGGAISGWPWNTQLSQPLRISAQGGGVIVSQPLAMAEWAAHNIRGGHFAAATADANVLLVPGGKDVTTGSSPDVEDIVTEPRLGNWQLPLLRSIGVRYVVIDRREISSDGIRGYYFSQNNNPAQNELLPRGVIRKFQALPGATQIYSNGTITVFDLEGGR
ncbi:MAG: hypothetical protein WB507_06655 [Solirubrobacterales bacterium]